MDRECLTDGEKDGSDVEDDVGFGVVSTGSMDVSMERDIKV